MSIQFDNTSADQAVDFGTNSTLSNLDATVTDITLSCWIRQPANGGTGTMMATRDSSTTEGFQLGMNSADEPFVRFASSSSTTSLTAIDDNLWHHVVAVNQDEGGSHKPRIWVDGLDDTDSQQDSGSGTTNTAYTIGARTTSGGTGITFAGNFALQDVRIYVGKALNSKEINTLFTARGKDNLYSNLHCRHMLGEETTGTTVSGSVRNLTINGLNGFAVSTPVYDDIINRSQQP